MGSPSNPPLAFSKEPDTLRSEKRIRPFPKGLVMFALGIGFSSIICLNFIYTWLISPLLFGYPEIRSVILLALFMLYIGSLSSLFAILIIANYLARRDS